MPTTSSPAVAIPKELTELMMADALKDARQLHKLKSKFLAFEQYVEDPVGFGEDILGESFTPDIQEVMRSILTSPVTIAKSGNGVGKSHGAARIAIWFYLCHPDSKVYVTAAPPLSNLKRILWGEIMSVVNRMEDLFSSHIKRSLDIERSADSHLQGLAIPTSGSVEEREAKFAGKHAPNMLFIVDEGDAVPDEVYRGIESCMSGGNNRMLILFNPRAKSGPIYQKERSGGGRVIKVSAFTHPNVVEGKNLIPGAVDRQTTVRRIQEWTRPLAPGEEKDHETYEVPAFLVGATAQSLAGHWYPPLDGGWRKIIDSQFYYMVLGIYPAQSEDQLVNEVWIQWARDRWDEYIRIHGERIRLNPAEEVVMGHDVAEKGKDYNAVGFRNLDTGYVSHFKVWRGMDSLFNIEHSMELYLTVKPIIGVIDGDGVGSTVSPFLNKMGKKDDVATVGVKAAQKPTPQIQSEMGVFKIIRDQLWWALREWLRTDPKAMLPPDIKLLEEIRVITYSVDLGVINVMKKDHIRERLRRSPDRADALCLTFAPYRRAKVRALVSA